MTVDVLPDDVLEEIFFYVNVGGVYFEQYLWHALVHVCRRWRYLMFASPRHLNIRLAYDGNQPTSKVLDVWPVLPLKLLSSPSGHSKSDQRWGNLVAALESE